MALGYFDITSSDTLWTNAAHDNAVFQLNHTNTPAAFWTAVSADGGDIRVYWMNGATEVEVAREITDFDKVGETGNIFFKSSQAPVIRYDSAPVIINTFLNLLINCANSLSIPSPKKTFVLNEHLNFMIPPLL